MPTHIGTTTYPGNPLDPEPLTIEVYQWGVAEFVAHVRKAQQDGTLIRIPYVEECDEDDEEVQGYIGYDLHIPGVSGFAHYEQIYRHPVGAPERVILEEHFDGERRAPGWSVDLYAVVSDDPNDDEGLDEDGFAYLLMYALPDYDSLDVAQIAANYRTTR